MGLIRDFNFSPFKICCRVCVVHRCSSLEFNFQVVRCNHSLLKGCRCTGHDLGKSRGRKRTRGLRTNSPIRWDLLSPPSEITSQQRRVILINVEGVWVISGLFKTPPGSKHSGNLPNSRTVVLKSDLLHSSKPSASLDVFTRRFRSEKRLKERERDVRITKLTAREMHWTVVQYFSGKSCVLFNKCPPSSLTRQ